MLGCYRASSLFLLYGILFSVSLDSIQGAWRNLAGRWTDNGAQWTGTTPRYDAIFHFGPTRIWTTPMNSGHYEITSRIYSSGYDCGHVFKYKVGSIRTRSLVSKAWGYYLSHGNTLRISSNGKEYSPKISYGYPLNQWNDLKTVVRGRKVTIYINNRLVRKVTMRGNGANSATSNYVGIWCHSSTRDTGKSFSVQDLATCPKLAVGNRVMTSSSKCVTSLSSVGTTCSFRCPRGFVLRGPGYKRCQPGGKWTNHVKAINCSKIDQCAKDNGGCSHVCTNTNDGYRCSCPGPEIRLNQDNHTCEVLGSRLTCAPNHMLMTLPKSSLPGVLVEDLRLLNSSCKATENRTHFHLQTAFNQCGTNITQTASSIVYTNKVLERQLANNTVITRIRKLEIIFKCSYVREKILTSSNVEPDKKKLVVKTHDRGNFTFTLRLFPNKMFKNAYSKFPVTLYLRQPIFLEVKVRSVDNELSVSAQSCYATPSRGVSSPRHWLVKNACPVDSTLKILQTSANNVQRFTFKAFRFVGNYKHVYFHCHVIACRGDDSKSKCARGCAKLGKRRVEEDTSFQLTQGPFVLREPGKEGPREDVERQNAVI